jgi:hypothetical protein
MPAKALRRNESAPRAGRLVVDIRFYTFRLKFGAGIVQLGNNCGGAAMGKKRRRISDGATFEEVQSLLLKCTRQLRTLMPPGADLRPLDRIETRMAWLALLDRSHRVH